MSDAAGGQNEQAEIQQPSAHRTASQIQRPRLADARLTGLLRREAKQPAVSRSSPDSVPPPNTPTDIGPRVLGGRDEGSAPSRDNLSCNILRVTIRC